jgi:Integrase zinc binding domain
MLIPVPTVTSSVQSLRLNSQRSATAAVEAVMGSSERAAYGRRRVSCRTWHTIEAHVQLCRRLCSAVLDLAHEDHPSVKRMKQRCRYAVWYPGIGGEIQNYVHNYTACVVLGTSSRPTPGLLQSVALLVEESRRSQQITEFSSHQHNLPLSSRPTAFATLNRRCINLRPTRGWNASIKDGLKAAIADGQTFLTGLRQLLAAHRSTPPSESACPPSCWLSRCGRLCRCCQRD